MYRFIDKRLLLPFIRGKWRFDREVRALTGGSLMASICDGRASFLPWDYEEPIATSPLDKEDRSQSQWLLYREKGYLDNRENVAASGDVTRQYLYEFPKVNKPIQIYHCTTKKDMKAVTDPSAEFTSASFMENGFFHELMFEYPNGAPSVGEEANLTNATARVEHECKPDTYKGIIDIINDNRYSSKWSVTGPQKSYEIHTIYERLAE